MKPRPNFKPLSKKLLSFFAQRGITPATLERNRVAQVRAKYCNCAVCF